MTILITKVHSNSAGSATGSMIWSSASFTSDVSVKQPVMQWSSAAAKDMRGSPLPILGNSNLRKYMCGIPTPTVTLTLSGTITPTVIPPSPKKVKPIEHPLPSPPESTGNTAKPIVPEQTPQSPVKVSEPNAGKVTSPKDNPTPPKDIVPIPQGPPPESTAIYI